MLWHTTMKVYWLPVVQSAPEMHKIDIRGSVAVEQCSGVRVMQGVIEKYVFHYTCLYTCLVYK